MPNANIDGPKINDLEVKRKMVREITDAMEKAYKLPRQSFSVVIDENLPENIGIGGELLIDKAKR